jgi:hypothetical protein
MDLALVLDDDGWKKTGKNVASLQPLPGSKTLTIGMLDQLMLGSLEIPGVPAVRGVPVAEIEKPLGVDIDGIVGSGMFVPFRVTLADQGRTMWVEPMPMLPEEPAQQPASEPPPSSANSSATPVEATPVTATEPKAKTKTLGKQAPPTKSKGVNSK